MWQIQILIIDESPDFVKSFGNLIIDVFGTRVVSVKNAYNIEDGLSLASQFEFHYIFIRVNYASSNFNETRLLFKKISFNPSMKFIALSSNNESEFRTRLPKTSMSNSSFTDEIDVDDLASILEIMR